MISSVANLPFLQRFRPLAYTLVLIAIAAISYAESNAAIFFIGTLGTLASWWLVERPKGSPLPRAFINLGVLAASSMLFYELVLATDNGERNHPNLLLALGHFMVAILLCKLFERKTNRDYAQILTLTLLIMVAGAIVATSSLLFAILLACYLALGLYAILLFHLRAETERALATNSLGADAPVHMESPAVIKKDIRFVAAASAVLLITIATAVFLAFPRSSAHDMLSGWAASSITTGYTDQVRMRKFMNLQQSDALVMEVKLEQNGVPLGSESIQPYFRGQVLDVYDLSGSKWVRSVPNPAMIEGEYAIPQRDHLDLVPTNKYSELGVITQTYTMHAGTNNSLFAIGPPVSIASDQLKSVSYSPREMVLGTRGSGPLPLTYTVRSPVILDAAFYADKDKDKPNVEPGDLGSYRIFYNESDHLIPNRVPEEIVKLARDVARDLLPKDGSVPDPSMNRQIAERFSTYLQSNYPYSLRFRSVNPRLDPTVDFLLNRKETGGHCEFFASAMVMMCRAIGINARMALGFHGGEFNSIGGFYVVKQKYAHAWVEVFLPRRGWTIYDPSPSAEDASPASAVSRWFHEVSEVMQKAWLSTVVAFDNTSRKYIFNTVSAWIESGTNSLKTFLQSTTEGFKALFTSNSSPWYLKAGASIAIAGVFYLFIWLMRSWNRRRTSHMPHILKHVDRKTQRQLAYDLMFFDDLLRILGRKGPKKLPEQTPREYVEKLTPLLQTASTDAHWLITTFYDIRFGTLRVSATLRQQIDAALQRIRQQLQRPTA
jgi:transglutaminase-like putative cysteine protease